VFKNWRGVDIAFRKPHKRSQTITGLVVELTLDFVGEG
jgi:hypothetical protein